MVDLVPSAGEASTGGFAEASEHRIGIGPVLAHNSHPFERNEPLRRSVAESLPASPTRKAGHESLTVFLRAVEHRLSLPGSQTASSPVDEA